MVNTFASCFGNLYDCCAKSSLGSFCVVLGDRSVNLLYSSFYFTKILFLADLMLANLYTSKYNMKIHHD